MHPNRKLRQIQQQCVVKQSQQVDAYDFFNLLTSDELLSVIESLLPDHRERLYPPTETLAMFLAQVMQADGSCQRAVNEMAIKRMLNGLSMVTTNTGAYCKARERLPLEMLSSLCQQTGQLVAQQALPSWSWQGRPMKLIDGTTVTMLDTPANGAKFVDRKNVEQAVKRSGSTRDLKNTKRAKEAMFKGEIPNEAIEIIQD